MWHRWVFYVTQVSLIPDMGESSTWHRWVLYLIWVSLLSARGESTFWHRWVLPCDTFESYLATQVNLVTTSDTLHMTQVSLTWPYLSTSGLVQDISRLSCSWQPVSFLTMTFPTLGVVSLSQDLVALTHFQLLCCWHPLGSSFFQAHVWPISNLFPSYLHWQVSLPGVSRSSFNMSYVSYC